MSVNLVKMIVIAITTVSINSVATSVFVTVAMLGMEQIAVSFLHHSYSNVYLYVCTSNLHKGSSQWNTK